VDVIACAVKIVLIQTLSVWYIVWRVFAEFELVTVLKSKQH